MTTFNLTNEQFCDKLEAALKETYESIKNDINQSWLAKKATMHKLNVRAMAKTDAKHDITNFEIDRVSITTHEPRFVLGKMRDKYHQEIVVRHRGGVAQFCGTDPDTKPFTQTYFEYAKDIFNDELSDRMINIAAMALLIDMGIIIRNPDVEYGC